MTNLTITNNQLSNVVFRDADFEDDLLTFAGAGTELEGTILARDSVSLKLVPFVVSGVVNENGIPKAVLTFDVTAIGAGDEAIRALVSGKVREQLLIISAVGIPGSGITNDIKDQLRDYNITALSVAELNILDNQ